MKRTRRLLHCDISQSSRVNRLSDFGALLYTWMIPYYDDEGRMNGDPEDVRFNIFPRRNVAPEDVEKELLEMENLGLIDWYLVENKPFIQMNPEAWQKRQTFHGIKRIPSEIEKYNLKKHKKYKELQYTTPQVVDEYTTDGEVEHQEGCSSPLNPVQRDKIRLESSFITNVIKEQPPADSSKKHFSAQVNEKYRDKILDTCSQLTAKNNGKKSFNPWKWIQTKFNEGPLHPQAIIDGLQGLLDFWDSTRQPWPYIDSIFMVRNMNYNEAEQIAAHRILVQEMNELENTPDGKQLAALALNSIQDMENESP